MFPASKYSSLLKKTEIEISHFKIMASPKEEKNNSNCHQDKESNSLKKSGRDMN